MADQQVIVCSVMIPSGFPVCFRYLELSLQGNVSVQNVPYVWKSLRTHPGGVTAGFKFLRSNWERIYAAYKSNFGVIKEIAQHFLSHLSTKVDLEDVRVVL